MNLLRRRTIPYKDLHYARLRSKNRYGRIHQENNKYGSGIHAVWGITAQGKTELYEVLFSKSKFTFPQMKKWLKEHKMTPIKTEPAKNEQINNAVWSTKYVNDLPDSAFLYIEPGGEKDDGGKTKPRSLRHFPYKDSGGKIDLPHLRNALARIPQSNVPATAKKAATAKAKRLLKSATKNESRLQHVTINFKPNIRYDTMEGREFLVVPCISIVEGVHNGSNGPLYYPSAELAKTPQMWNAKPVVVYHPEINGVGVSACDPVILSSRKIGVMMNTEYSEDNAGLSHEIWIDTDQSKKVDDRILESIQNLEIMEVSTGLFTDNDYTEGEWNGEPYTAIARNYRPDHLALLPDKTGACSIEDGAGFLRVNAENNDAVDEPFIGESWAEDFFPFLEGVGIDTEKLVYNKLSHDAIRSELYGILRSKKATEECYIEEVYGDFFVYMKDGNLFMQKYEEKDSDIKFTGLPEQVFRVVEYKTAGGTVISNKVTETERKENMMDKEKLISDIIANEGTRFTDDDKDFLEAQEQENLAKLMPPEKNEPVINKSNNNKSDANDDVKKNEDMTVDEYVGKAPREIQDVLRSGLSAYQAEQRRLINTITANKRNAFSEEQLKAKNNDELRAIARLATEKDEKQPIFTGQGDTIDNNEIGELPVPKPVVLAATEKKEK